MSIFQGTKKIGKIYQGNRQIKKIYQGIKLVYEYQEPIVEKNFYIEGEIYTFKQGMTWIDFVNSDYNINVNYRLSIEVDGRDVWVTMVKWGYVAYDYDYDQRVSARSPIEAMDYCAFY